MKCWFIFRSKKHRTGQQNENKPTASLNKHQYIKKQHLEKDIGNLKSRWNYLYLSSSKNFWWWLISYFFWSLLTTHSEKIIISIEYANRAFQRMSEHCLTPSDKEDTASFPRSFLKIGLASAWFLWHFFPKNHYIKCFSSKKNFIFFPQKSLYKVFFFKKKTSFFFQKSLYKVFFEEKNFII